MKRILFGLFILGFFVPSIVQAACSPPATGVGGTYMSITGLTGCADVADCIGMYYAYTHDGTQYPNSGTESVLACVDFPPIYFQLSSDWTNGGTVSCPVPQFGDATIGIIAWDDNPATADNAVQFIVLGTNQYVAMYNFDEIDNGNPDPYYGTGNNWCPLQSIPQPQIATISGVGPYNVNLTWTDPGISSYRPAGAPEYMYGFRVYYATTAWDGVSVPTPPASNDPAGWTVVDGGDYVPYGSGGGTAVMNAAPAEGETIFFALTAVGQGNLGITPFETGFVGQSSANSWGDDPLADPGAITLISFTAYADNGQVVVGWETGSEVNTAGFNILKEIDGKLMKINRGLIPAKGTGGSGAVYDFADARHIISGINTYYLQEVEMNNVKTLYGSVSVTIGKTPVKQVVR
jgi:hypothetical protein